MANNLHGSVCLNHPNELAVARCATCSKPICKKCMQVHDGVPYCSKLCYENAVRTGAMVEDVMKRKDAGKFGRMIRNIIVLVIVIAIALFGWSYYKKNKRSIDYKLKKAQYEAERKVQEGKNTIKKNTVDRKSDYKKQRENMVNQ